MTRDDGRLKIIKSTPLAKKSSPYKDIYIVGLQHKVNKKLKNGGLKMGITLKDTVKLMNSEDWKERLKAEYFQTKIRWNKLRLYYSKIKAKLVSMSPNSQYTEEISLQRTEIDIIKQQINAMDDYLLMLEMRAGIHGIDLEGDDI